ncbi:MAG TPA: AAA family ATPase [Solirubrobacteraceae bacterium]|nr:AAA family ATPase [Solirubrobacteraceae bacterium]
MRLKSVALKGFKSFPDRTQLDFGPGVSVVVGSNGSGKSNVTDAVLWAMGEQSPLAVRGQSMQDVIFGGGRGVQPRSSAEVEIVLDNADGAVDLPLSEISIVRRLDRNGEGGYSLNGARCRLTDVIEVLSDTGLGKESHSVISQGRVDAIVTSKPRDRRLLIEEAAGLGKHRKRRRRAQLKLERTQENLDRALDVEREARSRLRPLKRQAEAAELHERLELQILQARLGLAREAARGRGVELQRAQAAVQAAREQREHIEQALAETVERRGVAERALAERSERVDRHARAVYDARSARERIELRAEQVAGAAATLARRIERVTAEMQTLEGASSSQPGEPAAGPDRIAALETELAALRGARERELADQSAELAAEHARGAAALAAQEDELATARAALERADVETAAARGRQAESDRALQAARREAERIGAELAAVNQFLRAHLPLGAAAQGPRPALGGELRVEEGYELALAAALGGRLDAVVVDDLGGAQVVLDRAGPDGGTTLLAGRVRRASAGAGPPVAGARRLLELVSGPEPALALARGLLADAWVVERLEEVPGTFEGIAVTREGRVWFAAWGEVRQLAAGGSERLLERRNERDRLVQSVERAAEQERTVATAREQVEEQVRAAIEQASAAEDALRRCERGCAEAREAHRHTGWLLEQRRSAPAQGPTAVRIAEAEGELAAERHAAQRREQEMLERAARLYRLRAQLEADRAAAPLAERLARALAAAGELASARVEAFAETLAQDRRSGEAMAEELRACAARESEIHAELRGAGEAVTTAEVAAQRARDQLEEAVVERNGVAARLGVDHEGEQEAPLADEEAEALRERIERLGRRRELLGPVNPLAADEYQEALAHVEELESQRADLEQALRELRGLIRETDRQIQEAFEQTFAAASRNFSELVGDVFPGGSGCLRLVEEERTPSPVLGGAEPPAEEGEEAAADEEEAAIEAGEESFPGVEIEITPAGKSTKRLTLLSGGEKSMTALAFLFAVFLARPCPFYILDEVEAALDDLNLERFLALLRRYADRAQFIVITHQKRTIEAADWLYGVSMGSDGVSKVISRRLPGEREEHPEVAEVA